MLGIFSCKGCVPPVRHVGCHSTCEKYLAEKESYEKMKEQQQKDKLEHINLNSNGTYFSGRTPYSRRKTR